MRKKQRVGDRFAKKTHSGHGRTANQDTVATISFFENADSTLRILYLFVVVDGIGVPDDGEHVDSLVTREVMAYVYQHVLTLTFRIKEPDAPEKILSEALQKAHEAVRTQFQIAQATATVVLVIDNLAYIAQIGENRAYLIHKYKIEQLTRDHPLLPSTPEPTRHYHALGADDSIEIDTLVRHLPPGSQLVLCSDGLWRVVADKEILRVVSDHPLANFACNSLIQLATDRDGPDDMSAIVYKTV